MNPGGANNGSEEWATRRWISTAGGPAEIVGHMAMLNPNVLGTGVFVRIYQNHNLVYEHFLAGTDAPGTDYLVSVSLEKGDVIDFTVAPHGPDYFDNVYFSSSVLIASPAGSGPFVASVPNDAGGQRGVRQRAYVSIYGLNFAYRSRYYRRVRFM